MRDVHRHGYPESEGVFADGVGGESGNNYGLDCPWSTFKGEDSMLYETVCVSGLRVKTRVEQGEKFSGIP